MGTADKTIVDAVGKLANDIKHRWGWYVAMAVTGIFTWSAGLELTSSYLLAASLVALSEGGVLFWTARADERFNPMQSAAVICGLVLSFVAVVATDTASATIMAANANVEVFSAFAAVPEWAQRVVVYVLPVLGVGHSLFAALFYYFDEIGAARREERRASIVLQQEEARGRTEFVRGQSDRAREAGRRKAESEMNQRYQPMVANAAETPQVVAKDRPENP